MRLDTGPVCIVLQTAPKTTPRPTPRDASRMRDVRTQLAPARCARAGRVRGGGAARRWRVLLQRLGVVFERVRVCAGSPPRRRPQQQAGHGCSMKLRRRRTRFRWPALMRRSKAEVLKAQADRPPIVAAASRPCFAASTSLLLLVCLTVRTRFPTTRLTGFSTAWRTRRAAP